MAVGTKADAKPEELRGTLPAGTRLRNYELISVLGHGGFGITYYARDTTLGREVAVKEYLPTSLALRENGTTVVPRSTQLAEDFIWGRERFLEEARILATLEGVPSIVRVYDYLEANGTAYMVMGLARGETLDQRLKRDKQLAPAIIERMLERLLGGLEEVHKAGFLHRDVKPANIILDAKDNPTLIDFGASRAAMADRTAAMTAIFTPRYAAAEQLTSDKQGPWTDIYSISATLYHSITGRPPPSSLERALNDTYEPLAGLSLAGFSSGTLQGIDAGLALRAKDRPQSIAVWRDVLLATEAADSDATVVRRVKPGAVPKSPLPAAKAPDPAPKATAPPTPPSARSEPSRMLAIAGKSRLKLYAGVMVAIVTLAAGGYLVFATKPAPSPAPFGDQKADGRDAAAKAQAERQRAEQAAKQKAEAEAQQKAAAEAQQKAAAEAQQKAATEAQRKAAAEAQQKAAAEAQRKAAAEAQQKAAAEAQQKAAAEAQQKAAAEAQHKAAAEAQQKADAEAAAQKAAEAKAAAEAQQKAAAEAQQKAAAEAAAQKAAEAKAAAEAQQKAAAEAQQKAAADAAAQKAAEAAETALHLSTVDRQRIQVALTSLGFDTHGADGVFGPRSREMITDWQRARNQPATGFLIAAQQQALLSDAAPALAKYDDEQKKAEEVRRKEEAAARARAAASPPAAAANPPSYPRNASGGVSCQDSSGRRIEFPGASSCPYGLTPAR
jgi:serine/threonine protein kinase/peptidoglycan hydrolase-like protein with peptidoglycan-binding domain